MAGKPMSTEEFKKKILEKGIFLLDDEFLGTRYSHKFECSSGHVWNGIAKGVLYGKFGCVECAIGDRRTPISEIISRLNDIGIEFLDDFYVNNTYKHTLRCKKGHVWKSSTGALFSGISGCPQCRDESLRLDILDIKRTLSKRGIVMMGSEYKNNAQKLSFKCKNGHVWESSTNNILYKHSGCPVCAMKKTESGLATNIKKYISNNFEKYEHEAKIVKNPKTGRYLPYDSVIFDFCRPIFIEIHGQQHYSYIEFFHGSIDNYKYRRGLDKIKSSYAKNNGIYVEIDIRKYGETSDAVKYLDRIIKEVV